MKKMMRATAPALFLILAASAWTTAVSLAAGAAAARDPWTNEQLLNPADLAKTITDDQARKPLILQVGFKSFYKMAHIPGSRFAGPGSEDEGIDSLKSAARDLSRRREVVIYCGCCPMKVCPNIRPAYSALKGMGFTRIRVLDLQTSFEHDWIDRGYPVEKGSD